MLLVQRDRTELRLQVQLCLLFWEDHVPLPRVPAKEGPGTQLENE